MSSGNSVPIEQFIQALTTQLDRAQSAMAMKAENLDLPLTFAVKDLSLDLRTHIDVVKSQVHIRPAGPGEKDASTLHIALTTITKPMIKENARALTSDPNEPTIKERLGDDLTDDEQTRLEWAGVQTVAQLRKVTQSGAGREVERVASLPVDRIKRALERAAQPSILRVEPQPGELGLDFEPLVRVRGRNLIWDGPPHVSIDGQPVSIVRANHQEIVIAPQSHQMAGMLSVATSPGTRTETAFDLAPHLGRPAPAVEGGEA